MSYYIDFHALQSTGPANLNRDDSGSPKSTVFGGTRRARVSSQSWKRAIRREFEELVDPAALGERTLRAVERIAASIVEQDSEYAAEAETMAVEVLKTAGLKMAKPKKSKDGDMAPAKPLTEYLVFLGRSQIEALAALAIDAYANNDGKFDKKLVKQAFTDDHAYDVALFGRMIADAPDLNADACCQVAHAISVHPLDAEFDYFTAVDDNAPEDNAGAGMIGTLEFNSSTYYRYATINVPALIANLGSAEAAAKALAAFARAFAISMPTGKQNTFANRTRPEFFAVSIRDDQPVSFVDAFEDAITAQSGRMTEAVTRLAEYAANADAAYGSQPNTRYLATGSAVKAPNLDDFGEKATLDELVAFAEAAAGSDTGATDSEDV